MTAGNDRAAELSENLSALRARIAAACEAAGRPADDVTLIAITKTFPASDVRLLAGLGITDVGENRDQEAAPKAAACAGLEPPLRWHFVGQLQANKARSVVTYADVVHSVDRPKLVRALGTRARAAGRVITCLIQVDLDPAPDPERGGAQPADVAALADEVAAEQGLALGGVMAVAPLGEPPRPAFRRLAGVAQVVRAAHPGAMMISAGMTGDLDAAIAEGATHVRVGTALLGSRRVFVR
ncbi:MAG TPA: YggS family pyridoxal phosphate-dependent enzyme [Streptosporangiaceae bacterium]|nr:YggS family pyridoxal phosphate-dependent enzyme [Streptosporangiaceae bacterium]